MIYDLHNDLLTYPMPLAEIKAQMEKDAENAAMPIYAVFTTRLKEPLSFCEVARRATPFGKFAIEDIGFATERNIDRIIALRPMYCGLCWNNDNPLAGGALGDGELTPLGKKIIDRLNEANICIDTAHLNRKSFWKVMESEPKRVICSHTAVDFANSHLRNLTKEQIYAIIMCGGIVGITFVSEFLSDRGQATVDDLCRHIVSFLATFGEDSLAIGSDFYGTKYGVKGIYDYEDFGILKDSLERAGVKERAIEKIFYLNAVRYWSTDDG